MSHSFELLKGMEAEATLDNALTTAFKDERYHDITLKGNDGVTVSAIRIALSVRSKYFETLFMGSYRESTSTTIDTGYSGEVLKAVVEYIHTDKASILVDNVKENDGRISEAQTKEFQTLVTLTEAAAYYNLPNLCYKAHNCMKLYLKRFPSLSIPVLEATSQGPVISDDLLKTSLANIIRNDFAMLAGDVLASLSSSALSTILEMGKQRMPAQQTFELIHKWASANPDYLATAQTMIQSHVQLHLIDPDVLSSDFEPTGLVTDKQLLDAFRHQAKKAKHDHNVSFHDPKSMVGSMWTHARSNVLSNDDAGTMKSDLLNIPPMTLGNKYRWTTKMESDNSRFQCGWLGVTKATTNLVLSVFGGNQQNCWGIDGYNGSVYSFGARDRLLGSGAKFRPGSVVTLTLDISEEAPNNGSLSIAVDGGETILAISNMCNHVEETNGFLPAVTFDSVGRATIQHIERL